jgi:hypothetical protein
MNENSAIHSEIKANTLIIEEPTITLGKVESI